MRPLQFRALALALAGLAPLAAAAPQAPADPGPAVLRIDGREVPSAEFDAWLVVERGELHAIDFAAHLRLLRIARERGIEPDPAALAAQFEAEVAARLAGGFGGERAGWVAELATSHRTPEGYRRERLVDLEREQLGRALAAQGRVVPEAKLRRDWELVHGPGGRRLSVRAIHLPLRLEFDPALTGEEREALRAAEDARLRAELEGYRARVLAGEEFALLARQHSGDPETAPAGGLFDGPFSPAGWGRQVVDALVALPPGGMTEPLAARGGWWLFQLVASRDTPFESVRAELEAALVAAGPEQDEVLAAIQAAVAGLRFEPHPALLAPDLATADGRLATAFVADGEAVTLERFADWLRGYRGEQMALRFVESDAVLRAAAAAGVEVTPEAVAARVERDLALIVEHGFDDLEDWKAHIAGRRRTEESWRREAERRLRLTLLCEALLAKDRVVPEAEVRTLWAERYGADGRRIDARLIAIDFEVEPPRGADEPERTWRARVAAAAAPALATLGDLRARALDGEDFGALAKQHSTDAASAPLGGVPPGGFDLSAFGDDLRATLLGLRVGEVSEPLLAGTRALLFESTGSTEVPFERVREELLAELLERPADIAAVAGLRNTLVNAVTWEPLPGLWR